ncbi:MAG: hypothetical protein M1818_002192 [Claussenomyces sp. TS43310]|nr:MAG: hypothetical protein M1818_002192 [Claussenomyces sp. TS43310]
MAQLWDPCAVLDVYPNSFRFTCVGVTQKGARCRNSFISSSDISEASKILKDMSQHWPLSKAVAEHLIDLARLTLCPRWHRKPGYSQVDSMCHKWRAAIRVYVSEQKAIPASSTATSNKPRPLSTSTTGSSRKLPQEEAQSRQIAVSEISTSLDRLQKVIQKLSQTSRPLVPMVVTEPSPSDISSSTGSQHSDLQQQLEQKLEPKTEPELEPEPTEKLAAPVHPQVSESVVVPDAASEEQEVIKPTATDKVDTKHSVPAVVFGQSQNEKNGVTRHECAFEPVLPTMSPSSPQNIEPSLETPGPVALEAQSSISLSVVHDQPTIMPESPSPAQPQNVISMSFATCKSDIIITATVKKDEHPSNSPQLMTPKLASQPTLPNKSISTISTITVTKIPRTLQPRICHPPTASSFHITDYWRVLHRVPSYVPAQHELGLWSRKLPSWNEIDLALHNATGLGVVGVVGAGAVLWWMLRNSGRRALGPMAWEWEVLR